jgi:hypothetical protein
MELIISKKIKEIEETLTHCIEDIKIVSSLDKECKIVHVVRDKLTDITTWLDVQSKPELSVKEPDKDLAQSSEESGLDVKEPDSILKKESIPSFMLPTFSFLSGTSFTPHMYLERRSNSTERAMSNEKSQQKLRSESIERTRNRSESVERVRNRSESVERLRNRSESVERLRNRSESVDRLKNRSESVERTRYRLESELNRNGRIERIEFRSESAEPISKKP